MSRPEVRLSGLQPHERLQVVRLAAALVSTGMEASYAGLPDAEAAVVELLRRLSIDHEAQGTVDSYLRALSTGGSSPHGAQVLHAIERRVMTLDVWRDPPRAHDHECASYVHDDCTCPTGELLLENVVLGED